MAEWSKAHAWKVCIRQRIEGSNPSPSAKYKNPQAVWLSGFFIVQRNYSKPDTITLDYRVAPPIFHPELNRSVMLLIMNSKQMKKWLEQQGAIFQEGKGSHLKVFLNGTQDMVKDLKPL